MFVGLLVCWFVGLFVLFCLFACFIVSSFHCFIVCLFVLFCLFVWFVCFVLFCVVLFCFVLVGFVLVGFVLVGFVLVGFVLVCLFVCLCVCVCMYVCMYVCVSLTRPAARNNVPSFSPSGGLGCSYVFICFLFSLSSSVPQNENATNCSALCGRKPVAGHSLVATQHIFCKFLLGTA